MLINEQSSSRKLKWWIYSVTSLTLIVLWGVVFQNIFHSWQGTVITERIVAQNLARSLAAHTSESFNSINYRLENIKKSLIQSEPMSRFSKQGTEILKENILSSEIIFAVHYFDIEGDMRQSTISTNGGQIKLPKEIINVADKEFFQKLKFSPSIEDDGLFIGRPVKGKITNEWTLPVVKAVYKTNGIFDGVIMAAVQVKYFSSLYKSFEFYEDSSVALSRKDGVFLARTPFNPIFFSKDYSDNLFFSHVIKADPNGHFEEDSSIDDRIRLISYQSLPDYPLVVSVTLNKEHLVSKWINEEMLTLVIASLSSLFLLFLARSMWVRALIVINQRDELEKVVATRTQELIESNQKLEQQAQIDGLTGLANRRYLEEQFEKEFRRAQRNSSSISVAMIDVDHFKTFNDTFGHLEGDECLKHVASVLNSLMRRSIDLVARYGGEEFICLLPETDEGSAHHLAEQLRHKIEKESFGQLDSGKNRSITVSIGVATTTPKQGDTYQQLIKNADMALYQAKADGRNLVR